jgi:hypothetical protein
LNIKVLNHERFLLVLAHGHEEVVTWREVKGVAKNLSPFLGFGNLKDKEPGRARMQESQNPKKLKECCLEQRRALKDEHVHRFSQRLCQEIKGTCGFVQGVPTGAQRAISSQNLE